ncbi:MAG TPA: hypothetical protein VK858_18390 [Longimicrobiales bacterium]|nr:hypothetical protein [Longimicrobiales bacterium]
MTDETREEAELEVLFRSLDNAPRRADVDDVIARAGGRRQGRWRLAAGLVAALAVGGAAWALPGSPVPGWVRSVLAPEAPPPPTAPGLGEREPPGIAPGGLAFPPDEELVVAIDEGGSGVLRILTTSEASVVVQTVSGQARFSSAPNRLGVTLGGPDTLEIRVPRATVRVVVTVGGRTVFSKVGDAVTTVLPRDAEGRWVREVGGGA